MPSIVTSRPIRRAPTSSNESAIAPRVEGRERRGPARVAPLEQEPRRGVDGAPVGRMRLRAEAPEIGVDEAGVERAGRELAGCA